MVRGEVGELVSIDGEKGTVKFEVAVTGGTGTWTDEYTVLRIHRDIVTLRAPGAARCVPTRSPSTRRPSPASTGALRAIRGGDMNGGERGSEERIERGRSAPLHHHVTSKITPPTLNFRS